MSDTVFTIIYPAYRDVKRYYLIFRDNNAFVLALFARIVYTYIGVMVMTISFGEKITEIRQAKGIKQTELARILTEYGVPVTNKVVNNWEKSQTIPTAEQFVALCDVLDVDDIMWHFAGKHSGAYTGLNQAGREIAREFINLLFRMDMYRDDPVETEYEIRIMNLYSIAVSAGTGNFLSDGDYEEIEVPEYVPSGADFALRVTGDSMEPLFQDGQIIWIKEQVELNHGEIGIFDYDNDAYCKKYIYENGEVILRSLNPTYKDIQINTELSFRIIGKVVS